MFYIIILKSKIIKCKRHQTLVRVTYSNILKKKLFHQIHIK